MKIMKAYMMFAQTQVERLFMCPELLKRERYDNTGRLVVGCILYELMALNQRSRRAT